MKNSSTHTRAATFDPYPGIFTTIGKDTSHWSFGTADRFIKSRNTKTPSLANLPSTLVKRATSFGYGKRWELINQKGKDAPSPESYNLKTTFELEKRAASFGPKYDTFKSKISLEPGPGAYNPYSSIGNRGPKFSFRPKMIKKLQNESPSPGAYSPVYKLREKSNYSDISFGKDVKHKEWTQGRGESPGPGAYDIPSTFNKSFSDFPGSSISHSRPVTRN